MRRWLFFPLLDIENEDYERYFPTSLGILRPTTNYIPTSLGTLRPTTSYIATSLGILRPTLTTTVTSLGALTSTASYIPTSVGTVVRYKPPVNYPDTAELTYQSDGDDNGLFYAMGSNFKSGTWYNPSEVGYINLSASSTLVDSTIQDIWQLTGRTISNFATQNLPNQYIQIDIGANYLFQVKKYLLRSREVYTSETPRNWKLEGSTNGNDWILLDNQVNNATLTTTNQWLLIDIPIRKVGAYRYFRLSQTGLNNTGSNYFCLGEIEFYGTFSKVSAYVPVPTPPIRTTYTYESDGDTNGILYAIGTDLGNSSWRNPNSIRSMVSASSVAYSTLDDIVDRQPGTFYTNNIANSYVEIDLGYYNRVSLNKYSIRHYNAAGHELRNWKLEGSNNKNDWMVLDDQVNNTSLVGTHSWLSLTPNKAITTPFRYLRLTQTGLNANNQNWLVLTEIEFYGELSILPPNDYSTLPNGSTISTYTYGSDGDTSGAIYGLATNLNTTAWSNPNISGKVVISASTIGAGTLNSLVDRVATDFYTGNVANSYIQIDIGKRNRLKCNKISLRNRSADNNHILRSWKWEGSNDLDDWKLIDNHSNDASMTVANQWYTVTPNTSTNDYFRYFRLTITGLNSSGHNHICLGEIEMYGDLAKLPSAPVPPAPENTIQTRTFTYSNNGDSNGVAYGIATNYGTNAWSNPVSAGAIKVFESSDQHNNLTFSRPLLFDRGVSPSPTHTGSEVNAFIGWDIGKNRLLNINYYSIQGREDHPHHIPSNWVLEGSKNKTDWTLIDTQSNITLGQGQWYSEYVESNDWYRYFRVRQTGPTNIGSYYLVLAEVETYGTLAELTPTIINNTYTYQSDGDDKGIFYALGTEFGKNNWSNPSNLITFSYSSIFGASTQGDKLVDRGTSTEPLHTNNTPTPSYVGWELGSGNTITMNHYSIRARQDHHTQILTSWNIEASNNGSNWTVIDTVNNAPVSQGQWFSKSIPNTTAYRYYKLVLVNNNSNATYLVLGELEVYGTLNYTY